MKYLRPAWKTTAAIKKHACDRSAGNEWKLSSVYDACRYSSSPLLGFLQNPRRSFLNFFLRCIRRKNIDDERHDTIDICKLVQLKSRLHVSPILFSFFFFFSDEEFFSDFSACPNSNTTKPPSPGDQCLPFFFNRAVLLAGTSALYESSVVSAFCRNFTHDVSPLTGENNKTRIIIIPSVPLHNPYHTGASTRARIIRA